MSVGNGWSSGRRLVLLEHLHYDTWFGRGTAQFVVDSSGSVAEMRLDVPNDDLGFHELEMTRRRTP